MAEPRRIRTTPLGPEQPGVAGIVLELDDGSTGRQQLDLVDEAAIVVVELDLDRMTGELRVHPIEDGLERDDLAGLAGGPSAGVIVVGRCRPHAGEQHADGQEPRGVAKIHAASYRATA